jgi:hypothetical protein
MPEPPPGTGPDARPGLDARLGDARTVVLDSIDQPPLARIRQRAVRRRRRRTAGGAALLAVAVAATLPVWNRSDEPAPPMPADAPPAGPVYADAGITINGLVETDVPRLPGVITDVEFVDPEHGYLLSGCLTGNPCPVTAASTADGGATWRQVALPADTAGWPRAELLAFPDGTLAAHPGSTEDGYASADGGRTWFPAPAPEPNLPGIPADPDDLLGLRPGGQRCAGTVEVWQPDRLRAKQPARRPLVRQPDFGVCWVAPTATADGAWWVGGVRDGAATVAVTRDGGTSWRPITLIPVAELPDDEVASVEVTSLGSHVYASVLGRDRAVWTIFHSADGGQTFDQTLDPWSDVGAVGGPPGELVPLLDGRLLATGTDQRWRVSADDGRTFTRAEGSLPAVGRLARTLAGYVAYDLFGSGWAAYSPDGATWRKLQIN